jgi:hypothetical protein
MSRPVNAVGWTSVRPNATGERTEIVPRYVMQRQEARLFSGQLCAVVSADEWDALTDVEAAVEPVIDMEAVGRVRALHKARPVGAFDYCEHCEWTWPCPTIRVIEATP